MSRPFQKLQRFFRELKRRNVYKVAVTYAVVAFIVWQAASLLFPALRFPEWTTDFVIVLTLLGFPVALVIAWAFEVTPEGVRRTAESESAEEGTPEAGAGLSTGYKVLVGIGLVGAAVAGGWYLTGGGGEAEDTTGPPRIAVLPFENIARDTGDAFFAQGMHEEVLNQLSKVSGLEVLSRTSVRQYRGTNKTVREISNELGGVDALLEGTVRRAGDQLRITAQLIAVPEDEHLWSKAYERTLSVEEIFDIQADIAGQITSALETELTEAEQQRIQDAPTDDLAAYDAYLQGRSSYFEHWATREPADLRRSIEAFRKAVRRDTSFAEAHAWLGMAYWLRSVEGGDRWLDSASIAVEQARAIEPELAVADLAQGWIYRARDSTAAQIASLRRAVKLQPSHALAKSRLADALGASGQDVEALRMAREAVQLAPRQPVVLQEMSDQLRRVGLYDAAEAWDRQILEIEPGHFDGIGGLAFAHAERGRAAQALATWQRYLEGTDVPVPFALYMAARAALEVDEPGQAKTYLEQMSEARQERRPEQAEGASEGGLSDPGIRAHLGLAELRLGNRERGRKILQEAADSLRAELAQQEASADTAVSFFRNQIRLAGVLAALGQRERALDRLEASETAVRRVTTQFLSSPFFDDDLRSHPRFQEIIRQFEARRKKLHEEVRQLGIDLYPPGAEPDSVTDSTQADG